MQPYPSYEPPGSQWQTPPRKGRTGLLVGLLVGAVVLILAVIIGLVVAFGNTTDKDPAASDGRPAASDRGEAASDSSVFYDRPGYDRKKLGQTIGDPFAITMAATKKTQALASGTKIIPACGVITMDDIQKQSLTFFSNSYGTPIIQNSLSESGEASFSPDPLLMPTGSDALSCSYGLTDNQSVRVTVNQSFTTARQPVDDFAGLPGFEAASKVDGWSVSKRTKELNTEYLLRKGTDTVLLTFDLDDAAVADTFVKQAIGHLNGFDSTPTGISEVGYKSPTFTQAYARSCDYITNDDLKRLTGHDMSPLTQEMWPTATGLLTSAKDGDKKSNYLRNQCIRTANVGDTRLVGLDNHTLRISVTSYENDKAASDGLLSVSVGEGNDSRVTGPGIGEEAYLYKSATTFESGQNVLAFRQGRFVAELLYDFAKQDKDPSVADLAQYGQKLSPLGEAVAAKLKNL